MKKDQYIPHEVSMRNTTEVMNLIESEGMAGYGIYWALMEYLRVQDGYVGDLQALAPLKRQLKIRQSKLDRVLHGFGLFVCHGNTFYSPKLNEVMKPFEDRRARIEAYKRQKQKENSLEINEVNAEKRDIVSFEVKGKVKGEGKEETTSSLNKKDDDAGKSLATPVLSWERHVNELRNEQSWIEIMAMRSGLGKVFVQRFDEVLQAFKEHVQSIAHESHIDSPSEAKKYFCFFNTPGSATFKRIAAMLQKPIDRGKYKHEDRDPATGKRSYCGIPIPADAPPRPNAQAAWCEEKRKWIF